MADIFAAGEGVPGRVTAGDLWTWRADALAGAYDPAGHALAYTLRPEAGGPVVDLALAIADSGGWRVEVAPAVTAAIEPGRYRLCALLTRASDGARAVAAEALLAVAPDPATSTGDGRSRNRRILDAIEATIEGRASKDAESYSIEGRSISRTPLDVLHKLAGHYRRAVAREEGGGPIHIRQVRFGHG